LVLLPEHTKISLWNTFPNAEPLKEEKKKEETKKKKEKKKGGG